VLIELGYAVSLIGSVAYDVYFHGSASGQTVGKRAVGKRALGIRVIDFGSGGPIGYGRATIRWLGPHRLRVLLLPGLPLDAVGQGEAVLARQDGERRRRARGRVSGGALAVTAYATSAQSP